MVKASLKPGEALRRGLMNRLEFVVQNDSAARVENIRLRVQIRDYVHVTGRFGLDGGSERSVSVTVGGHDDLSDLAANSDALVEIASIASLLPRHHFSGELCATDESPAPSTP